MIMLNLVPKYSEENQKQTELKYWKNRAKHQLLQTKIFTNRIIKTTYFLL